VLFQLFELGPDGGENEGDGELLAETEEVAFECAARYGSHSSHHYTSFGICVTLRKKGDTK